jgi:DNA-directed RNA polymerase specialized sigma24 family protein
MRNQTTETNGVMEIDWNEARQFIKVCLSRKIQYLDDHDREDLIQDASVRLIRAIRRQGARNLQGLMTTIAYRTAIDFIRSRRRKSGVFEPLNENNEGKVDDAVESIGEPGDPQQRVQFVVLEYFRRQKGSCYDLAKAFLESRNWLNIAKELGISHQAVRARGSRCGAALRKAVVVDQSFALLREWAEG